MHKNFMGIDCYTQAEIKELREERGEEGWEKAWIETVGRDNGIWDTCEDCGDCDAKGNHKKCYELGCELQNITENDYFDAVDACGEDNFDEYDG